MNEKAIEKRFTRKCRERGWWTLKFNTTSETGMPDRLVVLPGGKTAWVELKAPGKKPTELQFYQHARLNAFGQQTFIASTPEEVDATIEIIATIKNRR